MNGNASPPGRTACCDQTVSPAERTGSPVSRFIQQLPALPFIVVIRLYQKLISPLLGRHCRFHPSCSQYAILALRQYGLLTGLWKTLLRLARCHPWHPGGYDPP